MNPLVNYCRADDQILQSCVRELVFLCAQGGFQVKALHIKGKENRGPDWLSRFHQSNSNLLKFHSLVGPGFVRTSVSDDMFEFSHDW